jgi:hypothetical protein
MNIMIACVTVIGAVLEPTTNTSGKLAAPTIVSLTPSQAVVGTQGVTLVVRGSEFTGNSIVRWNGADRATTYVNAGELRATIPATDLATARTVPVTVFVPGATIGLSNSAIFTVLTAERIAAPTSVSSIDAITTVLAVTERPPDLEVKVAQPTTSVVAGTRHQYTVKVFNRGGPTSQRVMLRAALPPDLKFITSQGDHSFVCALSGTTLNCASGVFAARDSATIHVLMELGSEALSGHELVFGATADPERTIPESNEYNNSATAAAMTQGRPTKLYTITNYDSVKQVIEVARAAGFGFKVLDETSPRTGLCFFYGARMAVDGSAALYEPQLRCKFEFFTGARRLAPGWELRDVTWKVERLDLVNPSVLTLVDPYNAPLGNPHFTLLVQWRALNRIDFSSFVLRGPSGMTWRDAFK